MSKNVTNESFNQFLQALSGDETETGAAYQKFRASLIRFFQIKGDSEPETAADETLDRIALKFSQNPEIDNLTRYGFAVARFVFLERIRSAQKAENAGREFYSKAPAEAEETDEFSAYRECFQELPAEERKFLEKYFSNLQSAALNALRQKMADESGVSLNNLRVKIFRLRKRLADCLSRKRKNNFREE